MHQAVLLVGGNLGDREHLIQQTRSSLAEIGEIKASSSLYETEAWGGASEGQYLNQALIVETTRSPAEFILLTQEIEQKMGRKKDVHWGNRTMDIDIIYFDQLVQQDKNLILPHPWMSKRKFVLIPLVEILPDFIHPVYRISNQELLLRCEDTSEVKRYSGSPNT